MAINHLPILYVRTSCPWCTEVIDFLCNQGVGYQEKNVTSDPDARAEMQRKSGQTKTPTLDWYGTILSDFGVEELKPFLMERHVAFEDS